MKRTIVDETPEERERMLAAQREADMERDEIVAVGRAVHERLVRIGTMLREAREAEGLDLDVVSERSGIEAAALAKMEAGRQNITVDALERYSSALGRVLTIRLEEAA